MKTILKCILCILFIFLLTRNNQALTQTNNGCWKFVSVGAFSTIAILYDGTLWGWGDNSFGQLGNGTNIGSNIPMKIGTDNDWDIISTHHHHTLAIKKDGTLWTWGENTFGELGDGTTKGTNFPKKIGFDKDWFRVTAGGEHSVALKKDGSLWAWGNGQNGRLGHGDNTNSLVPKQVFVSTPNNFNNYQWFLIEAGYSHTLAVTQSGSGIGIYKTYSWGSNGQGQLGLGDFNDRNSPEFVKLVEKEGYNVSAGFAHSLIANWQGGGTLQNSLELMGYNSKGQIGNGIFGGYFSGPTKLLLPYPYQPYTEVVPAPDYTKLAATGDEVSLIIGYDLTGFAKPKLFSWGSNEYSELGAGTVSNQSKPIEVMLGSYSNIFTVVSNSRHSAALLDNRVIDKKIYGNKLVMWGWNANGQLGDGTFDNQSIPIEIKCPILLTTNATDKNSELGVNPNISNTSIQISIPETIHGSINLKIIDSFGECIQSIKTNNKSTLNIDVSNLTVGNYMVQIMFNNTIYHGRFLKI